MKSSNLARIAGWLLVAGPAVDIAASVSRPGTFPQEGPGGVQAAMQAGVQAAAGNPALFQLVVDVGFIASLALLPGFWAYSHLMGDSDGRALLRKVGLLFLTVALAVRTAAFASGFLLATIFQFVPSEALESGPTLDSAVMFLVTEGALSIFGTMFSVLGTAFFAITVMHARLLGSGKLLTGLMGVAPVAVVPVLFLISPFFGEGIFVTYVLANVVALVQVVWIIMFGAALLRKRDSFGAVTA